MSGFKLPFYVGKNTVYDTIRDVVDDNDVSLFVLSTIDSKGCIKLIDSIAKMMVDFMNFGGGSFLIPQPIHTIPQDSTDVMVFHRVHGWQQARFYPGEWHDTLETMSGREYYGPAIICGDDKTMYEIEEIGKDPADWSWDSGNLTHWMGAILDPNRSSSEVMQSLGMAMHLCRSPKEAADLGHQFEMLQKCIKSISDNPD